MTTVLRSKIKYVHLMNESFFFFFENSVFFSANILNIVLSIVTEFGKTSEFAYFDTKPRNQYPFHPSYTTADK